MAAILDGLDHQPRAKAVLAAALRGQAVAHAYLFAGPPGSGKGRAACAFAGALLAEGAADPESVRERVRRGVHPDLSWIKPSGATEMVVADIDQAVVQSVSLSPFEARRRVFVLAEAERLNEQAANRLLKTVEEPPPYAHLILLCSARERLPATLVSRCQAVPFDPLPVGALRVALVEEGLAEGEEAEACARLAGGNGTRARFLASPEGRMLRDLVWSFFFAALSADRQDSPWRPLLDQAREAARAAGRAVEERYRERLRYAAAGERSALQKERDEAAHRAERRARSDRLELALLLLAATVRDLWLVWLGAERGLLAADRRQPLAALRASLPGAAVGLRLERALSAITESRIRLRRNLEEELLLEALFYRLRLLLR